MDVVRSDDCSVCLQDFTLRLRSKHVCTYCAKSACIVCVKRYVLSSMSDPHCLHCRRALTPELLDSIFTKSFRKNELRRHRIQILMEQERSLFAQTLLIVEREDAHAAYMTAHERHVALIQRISPRHVDPVDPALVEEINKLRIVLSSLLARVQELGVEVSSATQKAERKEFLRKCPSCPEGFLSSAWRCHLCKTRVCRNCVSIKGVAADGEPDPPHTCKEEDVESARTIEAATKPCPHCGVRVQKSEGCNQMWCTACNNAFDWRTGQKVNGPVHNPHFHEFQHRNGATPAVNQWQDACENNRDPSFWPWIYGAHLVNGLQRKLVGLPWPTAWSSRIMEINRLMIERSVSARNYRPYSPAMYEDLRKRRLRRQIDDGQWAAQLSSRETKREKENRQRLLDELLLAVGRDTIGALIQKPTLTLLELENLLLIPINAAKDYYNDQMSRIARESNTVGRQIDQRWILRIL